MVITYPTFGHQIRTFPELLTMIPQFNITGQSVNPEQIVDIIPEQEKSDSSNTSKRRKVFSDNLKQVEEDKLRSDAKMFNQLADLSTTFGDILQKNKKNIDKIEKQK